MGGIGQGAAVAVGLCGLYVAVQLPEGCINDCEGIVIFCRHDVFCGGGADLRIENEVEVAREDVGQSADALKPEPLIVLV